MNNETQIQSKLLWVDHSRAGLVIRRFFSHVRFNPAFPPATGPVYLNDTRLIPRQEALEIFSEKR